jgi:hypothetical protein
MGHKGTCRFQTQVFNLMSMPKIGNMSFPTACLDSDLSVARLSLFHAISSLDGFPLPFFHAGQNKTNVPNGYRF